MSTSAAKHVAVHFHRDLDPAQADGLRARLAPEIMLTTGRFPDPLPSTVPPFEILVEGVPSAALLRASPRLRTLVIPWAGLPTQTGRLLSDFPDLAVHNLHYNVIPVAESALMLLLAASRQVTYTDAALRRGDWRPRYEEPPRQQVLHGRTALILGYGAIGRRVGELCRALGMTVLATRRTIPTARKEHGIQIYPTAALGQLLPQAHAVIVCLPLTPETRGVLDSAALDLLPRGALLVNIGRGAVVEQWALYEALRSGRLAAAGLDVWYNYPTGEKDRAGTFPADAPLHELPNVVMTPHNAAHLDDDDSLVFDHLATLLNHAARGEPLPNRVSVTAGY